MRCHLTTGLMLRVIISSLFEPDSLSIMMMMPAMPKMYVLASILKTLAKKMPIERMEDLNV